ncbi:MULTISPECIES: ferric reductase-like transmembrane domain-containing protein [unclassified Thioalkalivibrio]|uniref:ferredoxin reductase family protein n=1 Tax=unclassified Thioalkalivibrio TaxID=2621013 RepID=UPI000380374E|nr:MULTISPECIES: ferric reductase-like transmembrane domain-containing protein [unclassified Thioalkalivibrio]
MNRLHRGDFLLLLALLVPLWAGGHLAPIIWERDEVIRWLTQVSGVLALTCMLLAGILSIRLPHSDRLFGGLIDLWRRHHALGAASLLLAIAHVWLVAAGGLGHSVASAVHRLFPGPDHWPILAGWGALIVLVIVLAPTFKFFGEPGYARWKRLHVLSGLALLLGVVHAWPLAQATWPWWLLGILALAAYLWRKLLSPRIGRHEYRVDGVERLTATMVELRLRPEGEPLAHQPAQFVYLTPLDPGLASGQGEEHPFTIASAPGEEYLRIGIKALGDGSRALQTIAKGSPVQVEGPYGTFLDGHDRKQPAVWLGAGVGITPFVSAVRALAREGRSANPPVHLFQLADRREAAAYHDELERLANTIEDLDLTLHLRERDGLLSADFLRQHCADFASAEFWICGPGVVDRYVRGLLHAEGVPNSRIHSEAFHLL